MPRELSITVPTELLSGRRLVAARAAGSLSGYISGALATRLDADERRLRAQAVVDSVFDLRPDFAGDAAAARVIAVVHARAAALRWVYEVTGDYPARALEAIDLGEVDVDVEWRV